MEHDHEHHNPSHEGGQVHTEGGVTKFIHTSWLVVQYVFDRLLDIAAEDIVIIKKEGGLFLGAALALIGVFDFQTGKYCDGNATDYLSCTRPTAYYYYGTLELLLIVVGVSLIMLWFLKESRHRGETNFS